MPDAALSSSGDFDAEAAAFYRHVLKTLDDARLPYLVGGAFACTSYTGIERITKDVDLFIAADDYARAAAALLAAGCETELTYPHWLAKVHGEQGHFVDLIFSSGNGVSPVDAGWFVHAGQGELLGLPVRIAPVEETIWSKAFIMERERYDGADIAHLLQATADRLDWPRLVVRFGAHWRVLLAHLLLFGFVYPGERERVPAWVMDELLARLQQEQRQAPRPADARVCRGTLLSREQYLHDVDARGYRDARLAPLGNMAEDELQVWTDAIPSRAQDPPADAGEAAA